MNGLFAPLTFSDSSELIIRSKQNKRALTHLSTIHVNPNVTRRADLKTARAISKY
jgi:hypothetical protein